MKLGSVDVTSASVIPGDVMSAFGFAVTQPGSGLNQQGNRSVSSYYCQQRLSTQMTVILRGD
jgi:hypothetical protein